MKTLLLLPGFLTAVISCLAQDSAINSRKWELNGYIKDMETATFDKHFGNMVTSNQVHNRINIKWKPDSVFTAALEVRNRLFWGDGVSTTPGFTTLLRNNNERVNLSAVWISKNNFVLHSNVERLWIEWRRSKWNVRLGRQRINWGITTTWNPNDLFNAYNFLDFDYEERPGTDAAKIQYQINDASNLELAISPSDKKNSSIAAARYFINKWGYDLQIISGLYQNTFTFGFGWAGSLGNVGYKGEGQAFIQEKDSADSFTYSLELDYAFKNGWYIRGAVLHNSSGLSEPVNNWSKLNFQLSPQNLMPARWSIITTMGKEFTPLFSGNFNLVYSPQVNLLIVYPSLQYNLQPNLDLDLIWQSYFLELQHHFGAESHRAFLRLKWSF